MTPTKEQRTVLGNRKGERGMVLVVAILVLLLLSFLGATFLSVSLTESNIAYNEVGTAKAFNIAEAGVELGRSQVASLPWPGAFSNLSLPGLTTEYSTAVSTADANVSDWSTTPPSPLTNAKRIRWRGLTLSGGTYTVMGANVNENGLDLDLGQIRVLATGYLPNSTAPTAARSIEALIPEVQNFLKYGVASSGAVESDEIGYTAQTEPGGRNDSYNGGPGVFQPTLSTGYYSGGNVPTGGGWSSLVSLSTPLTFPSIDFARYASSPTVVNLNACRDVNGVVSLPSPCAPITPDTVYYVDGSIFVGDIGVNPTVSFIATHDIKNNATQGLTAVSGYPLFLTGGYIYMDTDNTNPLRGAIYSDGSHALAADRTYPIDPSWVGHSATPPGDLVYVESASTITGAVAARIPEGSGLRLFAGGGSTIEYEMNLLNGLANLYVDNSPSGGKKYISWREK